MLKRSLARRAARSGGALAVVVAAAAAVVPASATAASEFTCEASALRGAVLTAPAIEPVTANKGQAKCQSAKAGGADVLGALPLPLSLNAIAAQTAIEGSDDKPGSQRAAAAAGILDARVKTLPALPLRIPIEQIPNQTITIPVSQLKPITDPLTGLPLPIQLPTQDISVNITEALNALLPNGQLPNLDVLRVQALYSTATAECQSGKVAVNGSSRVAGITVLGQELPTDRAVDQTLNLVDTQNIDPSNIDVSKIQLPPGIAPELLPQVQALIKPALDALPTISIPATLVRVRTLPNQTIREGDKVTQRALEVQIDLLGQKLANLIVGEASVSARGVDCVAETAVAEQELGCTTRDLVLVDVLRRGDRVRLFGVADKRFIGKRVSIRSKASGKVVSQPVVANDGTFSGTAPLPARHVRDTNRARYQASVGSERSLDLKLARRMVWSSLSSRNGKVTLRGRVIRPFDKPMRSITLKRRVSCKKFETVKRFKPRRDGTFSVTVDAPENTQAATYRLQTFVRKHANIPSSRFHTFTLPRTVEIR